MPIERSESSTELALCCSVIRVLFIAVLKRLVASVVVFIAVVGSAAAEDYNDLVLQQVAAMPVGGNYSVNRIAKIRLQSAAHFESGKFFILPAAASPSFCSGATYLVFIRTLEQLRASGRLQLDFATLDQLMIRDQRDGEGIWGRWNANGPGTARLFHELGLGRNFDNFAEAKPGDFMKIFWSNQVGKTESGHSVIFLGTENRAGVEHAFANRKYRPAGRQELGNRIEFPFVPDQIDILLQNSRIGHFLPQILRRDIGSARQKQAVGVGNVELFLQRIQNADLGMPIEKRLKIPLILVPQPGGNLRHKSNDE